MHPLYLREFVVSTNFHIRVICRHDLRYCQQWKAHQHWPLSNWHWWLCSSWKFSSTREVYSFSSSSPFAICLRREHRVGNGKQVRRMSSFSPPFASHSICSSQRKRTRIVVIRCSISVGCRSYVRLGERNRAKGGKEKIYLARTSSPSSSLLSRHQQRREILLWNILNFFFFANMEMKEVTAIDRRDVNAVMHSLVRVETSGTKVPIHSIIEQLSPDVSSIIYRSINTMIVFNFSEFVVEYSVILFYALSIDLC